MDLEGVWRAPEEWPEDTPPLQGWIRGDDGRWREPRMSEAVEESHAPLAVAERVEKSDEQPRRSRQAEADRRAMLMVAGIIAGAMVILAAALILITQAGAEDTVDADSSPQGSVVFAAETDEVKMARRTALAAEAPEAARSALSTMVVRSGTGEEDSLVGFDVVEWTADRTDCLDIAEQVLVERSRTPIAWADNLECVPDRGRWSDRYLGTTISRTLDADVTLHVPAAVAYVSGGSEWTTVTQQRYLTDTAHPAVLEITSAGSGHNPRGQGPEAWKPSDRSTWCAYAIDWIAVKSRWELSVTDAERSELNSMLDTCSDPTSAGPDLWTMPIDEIAPPTIERIESASE